MGNRIISIGGKIKEKGNLGLPLSKGAALPIETTVFIILAVIVLAALLFLFSGTSGPGGQKIQLELQRSSACGNYVQTDPKCENPANTKIAPEVRKRIAAACKGLNALEGGYSSCDTVTEADVACVQVCCRSQCSGGNTCSDTLDANCVYHDTCDDSKPASQGGCPDGCDCDGHPASCTGLFYHTCEGGLCTNHFASVKQCPAP